ncbi:MAG: phospholipid carrier-dependent glycosyltransferase [Chloroflexi bacterium]|nr:phospholipid carrier-dependent glycosyltransferase [Chloroflexota bacterium]
MILFSLLSFGARQLFFTFDEPSHITSGYAFLARGATWTIPLRGHPLLVDAWLALPVYVGDPDIPLETLDGWGQNYLQYIESFASFLDADKETLERSQVAAQTQAILLTMLLAAVVYRWGADLWGKWGGLLALSILIFDPTLLAHGRLAGNDVGVITLGTLGLYLLWRWSRSPGWRRAVGAGLVLGMTMLAKSSGVLWVGVGLCWAVSVGYRRRTTPLIWLHLLSVGLLTLLVWWGMYGFSVGTIPGWSPIPVPAPKHWIGLLYHADPARVHTAIVLGKERIVPWLWYFPLASLIKNPIPLLIALPLTMGALLRKRRRWQKLELGGLFSIAYVIVAITRGPNLGYRHILPIHPMLYLTIAGGIGWIWKRSRQIGRWSIVILSLWYVVGTMWVYPHSIAFFNELVGGSMNGWRYLADSNTDWGQAWKALRAFRDEQSLNYSYSGPEGYSGITPYDAWNTPLPPLRRVSEPPPSPWLFPEPGDYVISGNTLSGQYLADPDNYSWFRYHRPDAMIAHTLFYYHVDAASAPAWLMQCTIPTIPLDEMTIAEGFEGIDLRTVGFDCSQSWVYPGGGQTRGAYALHGEILRPETLREHIYLDPAIPIDDFAMRHLKDVPLAYRQSEYRRLPAFVLYEWEGARALAPPLLKAHVAPADAPLAILDNASFHTAPLPLDGPLTFLGAAAYSQGETLDVETWWQVTKGPIDLPLSIMAHLLAQDGTVLGVADGLGVLAPTLETGDVVVQRHSFPEPPEGKIYLRTGAYWLSTTEMWPVADIVPGGNALFVPLDWK